MGKMGYGTIFVFSQDRDKTVVCLQKHPMPYSFDNDTEFAEHELIVKMLKADCCFAPPPYSF
jgi:IS30 family transposase